MSFKINELKKTVELEVKEPIKEKIIQMCYEYSLVTNQSEKAEMLKKITEFMDKTIEKSKRKEIMEKCGKYCIEKSIIEKALKLKKDSRNIDTLLEKLNKFKIGGGNLVRKNNIIFGIHERCYCESVNQSKESFTETFCYCSCGWYKELFERLLLKSIEVELIQSIMQGNSVCLFQIHI